MTLKKDLGRQNLMSSLRVRLWRALSCGSVWTVQDRSFRSRLPAALSSESLSSDLSRELGPQFKVSGATWSPGVSSNSLYNGSVTDSPPAHRHQLHLPYSGSFEDFSACYSPEKALRGYSISRFLLEPLG